VQAWSLGLVCDGDAHYTPGTQAYGQEAVNPPARGQMRGNRRLASRRACLLVVHYRADGDWHPATAMDLSLRGCRLRVGEDIPRGTTLAVSFERPLRDGVTAVSVDVTAEVIWARIEGISCQVGVRFPDSPLELAELIANIC
jgi:hypothetical protein